MVLRCKCRAVILTVGHGDQALQLELYVAVMAQAYSKGTKTNLVHHQHCVGQLGILQLVGDQHHHTAAQHTLQASFKQSATNNSVHCTERVIQQVHIRSTVNGPMYDAGKDGE